MGDCWRFSLIGVLLLLMVMRHLLMNLLMDLPYLMVEMEAVVGRVVVELG